MSRHPGRGLLPWLLAGVLLLSASAGAFGLPAVGSAASGQVVYVTREQFIVGLAQQMGLKPDSSATQVFPDVPPSDPDFGYVMAAHEAGWIEGLTDGSFGSTTPVARTEVAKFEVLALRLGCQASLLADHAPTFLDYTSIPAWDWGYVNEATAIGILKGIPGNVYWTKPLTVAEAAHAKAQLQAYLDKGLTPPACPSAIPPLAGVSISPRSGPPTGMTVVTVTGSGLQHASLVTFGSAPGSDLKVVSDTQLTVFSPPGTGTVDVTVTTPAGTTTTTPAAQFTYIRPRPHPLVITTTSLPDALDFADYSTTLVASGGTGTGYTWSFTTGGNYPPWLNLDAATGELSVSPVETDPASYEVDVTVTDSGGNKASAVLTLTVYTPLPPAD
jgi:hypothetical protein